MDSMRTLNTSLPPSAQPREELHRTFRNAAISVTNLYKEAIVRENQARLSGYQCALNSLLSFLDSKNIGLDDGEGWLVRRWATERLDGAPLDAAMSESDDERDSESKQETHPPSSKHPAPDSSPSPRRRSKSQSPARPSTLPTSAQNVPSQPSIINKPEIFSFRSEIPYPQDIEMPGQENSSPTTQPMYRLEIHPRTTRQSQRQANNRQGSKGSSPRSFGHGGGSKRKIPFGDLFDINSLGDGKDMNGPLPKRGRPN